MENNPKFGVKGIGQAWQQGVVADATIEFVSSGLVGTAYGFPGIKATLIGTGLYDVRIGGDLAERGLRVYPNARPASPSGPVASSAPAQFGVNVAHAGGVSGMFRLQTWTTAGVASGSNNGVFSGVGVMQRPINPPTGAAVDLLILGAPITRY